MRGPTTAFTHRGLSPHQFTPMSGAHEAIHRMSGTHICSRFEWPRMPLIGDLDRWADSARRMRAAYFAFMVVGPIVAVRGE